MPITGYFALPNREVFQHYGPPKATQSASSSVWPRCWNGWHGRNDVARPLKGARLAGLARQSDRGLARKRGAFFYCPRRVVSSILDSQPLV